MFSTIRCRACGEHRPYDLIGVKKVDNSAKHGFPAGTMQENYQYCVDKPECVTAASNFQTYFPKTDQ